MWKTSVIASEALAHSPNAETFEAALPDGSFREHVRAGLSLDQQGECVKTGSIAGWLGLQKDLKDAKSEEAANEVAAKARSDIQLIECVLKGEWDKAKILSPPQYLAWQYLPPDAGGNQRLVKFPQGGPSFLTEAAIEGLKKLKGTIIGLEEDAGNTAKRLRKKDAAKKDQELEKHAKSNAAAAHSTAVPQHQSPAYAAGGGARQFHNVMPIHEEQSDERQAPRYPNSVPDHEYYYTDGQVRTACRCLLHCLRHVL